MAECCEFLLIGQGLAGSLLGWELIRRQAKVMIVDNGAENASQIAAGLINPVTGMRFVKAPDTEPMLAEAKHYYTDLADYFQQQFYIEKPMLRLFRNTGEFNYAQKRKQQPGYQAYLGEISSPGAQVPFFANSFGYIEQKQTGYLLIKPLLKALKDFFIARNSYRCAQFRAQTIQLTPTPVWQDIQAKTIIFCDGYHALQNPWFNWLPFQAVKGEILTLTHGMHSDQQMYNFGHWLIPLSESLCRLGATFDRQYLDSLPSEQARLELLAALNAATAGAEGFNIIAQQANVRPCTLDKQPFIGFHPTYQQLAIFNGFGAKGSLQIPMFSRLFADALLNNTVVPSAINRFYASHFPA